jgi:hypothetical protein
MARPAEMLDSPPTAAATSAMRVVPVKPQVNASPNRKMAELNEPSRKYLMAPSVEYPSRLA